MKLLREAGYFPLQNCLDRVTAAANTELFLQTATFHMKKLRCLYKLHFCRCQCVFQELETCDNFVSVAATTEALSVAASKLPPISAARTIRMCQRTDFKSSCQQTDFKSSCQRTDFKSSCQQTDFKSSCQQTDFKSSCQQTDLIFTSTNRLDSLCQRLHRTIYNFLYK